MNPKEEFVPRYGWWLHFRAFEKSIGQIAFGRMQAGATGADFLFRQKTPTHGFHAISKPGDNKSVILRQSEARQEATGLAQTETRHGHPTSFPFPQK